MTYINRVNLFSNIRMIPFIMNCATVVAAILVLTGIDTTFLDRDIPISELKPENAVEVINLFVLIYHLMRTVPLKWLSRITSTTAREHEHIRDKYLLAFTSAIHIRQVGSWLHMDSGTTAMLQFCLMCSYWGIFWRKERDVHMCEEAREKWREGIRKVEALVAEQEHDMQQDPSPERERLLRKAQALFDKEKEYLNKQEQLMFRGGHLRDVKGFP